MPKERFARQAARMGAAADRELAAARIELVSLRARNAELEAQVRNQRALLTTLQRSQAARGKRLSAAMQREAALKAQLEALGAAVKVKPARPGRVSYLGQHRAAGSLLGTSEGGV